MCIEAGLNYGLQLVCSLTCGRATRKIHLEMKRKYPTEQTCTDIRRTAT